jgi:hypothetical protein
MSTNALGPSAASVDLWWLPLGAGDANKSVRWSGRAYEALVAHHEHRGRCDLYHSALEVRVDGDRFMIEMVPVWSNPEIDHGVVRGVDHGVDHGVVRGVDHGVVRGVVREGAVGLSCLGRSRFFRYEVHRWRDGVITDVAEAVDSPRRLSANSERAHRVLELVPAFPAATWGRDELRTGEMWNSNSLTSWLLARSGHDIDSVGLPPHGRAPGWSAGLVVAARDAATAHARTQSLGVR